MLLGNGWSKLLQWFSIIYIRENMNMKGMKNKNKRRNIDKNFHHFPPSSEKNEKYMEGGNMYKIKSR